MLKELQLKRFKKFKDLTVKFSPFTVLMGENSSGKTTILQALNLALYSLNQFDLITFDGSKIKVRSKGVGLTKLPGIDLSDFREIYYAKRSRSTRVEKWVGNSIVLTEDNGNQIRLELTSLFGGFNIKCNSEDRDFSSPPTLQNKPPLFISGFVGLNAVEERIFPVALLDRLRSGHVSSVIRNLIFDMKENAHDEYQRLRQRLATDFSFHLENALFDEQQDLHVTAQYSELCEERSLSLDFNSSGSGFMQILQILAPIYRFCPHQATIVLLDEPDAHLHPNLQTTLANSLRKIRDELNIQIIISTHSTPIIRSALPSEVVPVSTTATICQPLTQQTELDDEIRTKIDSYHLAKSVISGKLIFFEDMDTSSFEKFDEIFQHRVFNGANTSPIIRGRGKTDRVPFQIAEILKEISGEEIEVIFVRDGDGLPASWREKLTSFASERRVKLIILERFEVENYLLNAKVILKIIQNKKPETNSISVEEINNKIAELLKETIRLSKFNYRDDLEEEIRQVASIMNLGEYRNPTNVKSAIRGFIDGYESEESLDELLKIGKGKEALKELRNWITKEFSVSFSNREILEHMGKSDLPEEIGFCLKELQSKEFRENPEEYEKFVIEDVIEEEEINERFVEFQPNLF
jgi:predicted ATPase